VDLEFSPLSGPTPPSKAPSPKTTPASETRAFMDLFKVPEAKHVAVEKKGPAVKAKGKPAVETAIPKSSASSSSRPPSEPHALGPTRGCDDSDDDAGELKPSDMEKLDALGLPRVVATGTVGEDDVSHTGPGSSIKAVDAMLRAGSSLEDVKDMDAFEKEAGPRQPKI